MTQLAGHEVCPSADVDEAWHLHLTQSRAYAQMCAKVFGRFLHHDPSKGGAGEDTRHRAMYARTLQRYEQLFGEPPNPELWPDMQRRFGPDQARLRPAERPASMRLPAARVADAVTVRLPSAGSVKSLPLLLVPGK